MAALSLLLPQPGVAAKSEDRSIFQGIRVVDYDLGREVDNATFREVILMALLDSDWLPLDTSSGYITAERTVQQKHYVKIGIRYGQQTAAIELLAKGASIGETCVFKKDGRHYQGDCVHRNYYAWIDELLGRIPVAAAKVDFIRSLSAKDE